MINGSVRSDTDYRVTIEQIGRLEQALLLLRESGEGSAEVLDSIAGIQYQEISRLRSELDASLGFSEKPCDLSVTLQGPNVGLGVAPMSTVATMLTNVRGTLQAISTYLITGQWLNKGRLPESISRMTDFQFAGTASGSLNIKLNLPEPRSLFVDDREPVERSVDLMLKAVRWVSSNAHIRDFEQEIGDDRLLRLLLTQTHRVAPSRGGPVQRVQFSGRFVNYGGDYILTRSSSARIRDALHEISAKAEKVAEEGKLRSVDVDSGVFQLRQRPSGQPDMRCYIPDELVRQALDYLVSDTTVIIEGIQSFDQRGRPSHLEAQSIYELGESC